MKSQKTHPPNRFQENNPLNKLLEFNKDNRPQKIPFEDILELLKTARRVIFECDEVVMLTGRSYTQYEVKSPQKKNSEYKGKLKNRPSCIEVILKDKKIAITKKENKTVKLRYDGALEIIDTTGETHRLILTPEPYKIYQKIHVIFASGVPLIASHNKETTERFENWYNNPITIQEVPYLGVENLQEFIESNPTKNKENKSDLCRQNLKKKAQVITIGKKNKKPKCELVEITGPATITEIYHKSVLKSLKKSTKKK
jgi:hypothetical protein